MNFCTSFARVERRHSPANTIMQVTRFIDPEWRVEFAADAVIDP